MKLFKRLFATLTVLVLALTISACTIDEDELSNLLGGNSERPTISSDSIEVSSSKTPSNCWGEVNSTYPQVTTSRVPNSSVGPQISIPPITSSSLQNQVYFYNFSEDTYPLNTVFSGQLNEHILGYNLKYKISSGKIYKPEDITFTGAWQLGKNGSELNKSLHILVPTSGYLSFYVSCATTELNDGYFSIIDTQNSNFSQQIHFEAETHGEIKKITVRLNNPSIYAIYEDSMYSTINVWAVGFSTTQSASSKSTQNASSSTKPSTSIPQIITPSTSTITSKPSISQTTIFSFENVLNGYSKGEILIDGLNLGAFVTGPNVKVTTSSGKTAKDGPAAGQIFTMGLQLGKNGTYDSNSLLITTSVCGTIGLYANNATSGVPAGEHLFLIDSMNNVVDSAIVDSTMNYCTMTIPSAGSYALVATEMSSINIWAAVVVTDVYIDSSSNVSSDNSSDIPTISDGTTTYEQLLEDAIEKYEQMLSAGEELSKLEAQLAYIETLKVYAGYYD